MKFSTLPGNSKPVSRLVCGCDRLALQGPAHLDAAHASGINAFDTARLYRHSEAVLGEWLRRHRRRHGCFIVTKGAHPAVRGAHRMTRAEVSRDINTSLRALGTDHVDLYLLHFDAPEVPAADVVGILNEIRASGRAIAIGGANFSVERVREMRRCATESGQGPFDAVSVQLSLPVLNVPMWPWPGSVSIGGESGRAAREWYEREQVAVFAYSVLGRGFFSGAFHGEPQTAKSGMRARFPGMHGDLQWLRQVMHSSDNTERYRRAVELGRSKGVTAAQIGIAYVWHTGAHVFAVSGWNASATLEENLAALDVTLTPDEIAWLGVTDE